jgi:hypothetical protein
MSGFDLAAMKRAIAQCDENIKVFEAAINKELNTKIEYQRIVRVLQEQAANIPKVNYEIEYVQPGMRGNEGDE